MSDGEGRKREAAIGYVQTTPAGAVRSPTDAEQLAHGSTQGMPPSSPESAPISDLAEGARLGRFVVRHQLGAGGMGVVFAGEDELGRRVAIKIVRGDIDQPAYRDRLLREAQAMGRLEHPHVVRVWEVGTDRGRLFVAMEFVDGVTLTKWLATPRAWRDVLAMFGQVGDGLAAVHRTGLVHRDFKPDNVLVDHTGHARVADFGLARVEDNSLPPLTRTGAMMGTPGYMAPEQQWGSDVDARADQYSFCVALREATRKATDLPKHVRAAIQRGLSYEAGERFGSMAELLEALQLPKPRRRPRWRFVALAAVLVVGVAAATIVIIGERVRTETHTQVVSSPPLLVPTPIVVARGDDAPETKLAVTPTPPRSTVTPSAIGSGARAGAGSGARAGSGAATQGSGLGAFVGPNGSIPTPSTKPLAKPAPPPTQLVRHEIAPSHRVPVRVAVHDLGYGGLDFVGDPTNDEQAQRDALAAQGPDDHLLRGAVIYSLGAVQRKLGKCSSAMATWASAFDALHKANEANRTDPMVWRFWVRTKFAMALCMLEEGRGLEAWAMLDGEIRKTSFGFTEEERAAFHAVAGIVGWETGEPKAIEEIRLGMSHGGSAAMKTAVENWAKNVGLK